MKTQKTQKRGTLGGIRSPVDDRDWIYNDDGSVLKPLAQRRSEKQRSTRDSIRQHLAFVIHKAQSVFVQVVGHNFVVTDPKTGIQSRDDLTVE